VNTVSARVRDLYESYPYPPLAQSLGFPLLAALDYVACVMWPRRRSLDGLRVLDAGCGTGHAAVELARRHPEVTVVGVDASAASLEVARRRAAQAGGAPNLTFCQGAIEELHRLAVGEAPFDYIISSGVLHHLAEPSEGARALASRLAPEGAIGLMVYAPHGRHGVYILQELLRRMANGRPVSEKIALAREVLATLPADHPFRPKEFADQSWDGDAGLVDLLLHVQDRSFTVPELRDMLGAAGLGIARFALPYVYRPQSYPSLRTPGAGASGDALAAAVAGDHAGAWDPAAIAELVSGTMRMHVALACHAAFHPETVALADGTVDFSARPIRSPLLRWQERVTSKGGAGALDRPGGARVKNKSSAAPPYLALSEYSYTGRSRDLVVEGETALFLERCDGSRSAEEIFAEPTLHSALLGQTIEQKRLRFAALVAYLVREDIVFLLGA
jgi:SAM-dependent methyltransferase